MYKTRKHFYRYILGVVIGMMSFAVQAQEEQVFTPSEIEQAQQAGSTVDHVSPLLATSSSVDQEPHAYVDLEILPDMEPHATYRFSITLEITGVLGDGSLATNVHTQKLTVKNNRLAGAGNKIDKQRYVMEGAYGANVRIVKYRFKDLDAGTEVVKNGTVPANIRLTIGHDKERCEALSSTVPEIEANPDMEANYDGKELLFDWNHIDGAKSYDLEWTWVDNYGEEVTPLTKNEVYFSERKFQRNSTRVRVSENNYAIPLVFGRGYLIYRVRAVGRFMEDVTKEKFGAWSSGPTNKITVENWPNVFEITQDHEQGKNWQFQASYAEEGKKKEVVSYFDGSLRNRQTVTTLNTDVNTVVGEVIYDAQGRPAVEVLPVPVNDKQLRYYSNFNNNVEGDSFSYLDFDKNAQNIVDQPSNDKVMGIESGASRYYSSENSLSDPFRDRLPSAEGFPMSQIEYTPDNTGRIRRKSGVGPTHQLGSGHEMEYYYGIPEQKELNRLFGYSVGNFRHYKKNMVLDPNRQLSISYLDPQGRTIATALAGYSPEHLMGLEDEKDESGLHKEIRSDLLGKVRRTDIDTNEDTNILGTTRELGNLQDQLSYSSVKTAVLDETRRFTYDLSHDDPYFTMGCVDDESYPLAYDLSMDVLDDEANSLMPVSVENTKIVLNGQQGNTFTLDTLEIPVKRGAFTITKKLMVDSEALKAYVDDYISRLQDPNDPCYVEPQSISPSPLFLDDCFSSCEECEQSLLGEHATADEARQAYVDRQMETYEQEQLDLLTATEIQQLEDAMKTQWDQALQACNAPCSDGSVGEEEIPSAVSCQSQKSQLLQDVSPLGQYGTGSIGSTKTILNVFNEDNRLLSTKVGEELHNSWRNPRHETYDLQPSSQTNLYTQGHYYNRDGTISYIAIQKEVTLDDDGEEVITYVPSILEDSPIKEDSGNSELVLVEPQYLEDASLFIHPDNWQDSWANSLLVYHPEYKYLLYSEKVCELTESRQGSTDAYFNPDGYDNYLKSINTFSEAVSLGLLSSDGKTLSNQDPYFTNSLPDGFETNALYSARKAIVQEALIFNYDGSEVSLMASVYKTIVCNTLQECSVPAGASAVYSAIQGLSENKQNQFWNSYKANYLGLKQRILSTFMDAYALKNGFYNGCIGTSKKAVVLVARIDTYNNGAKAALQSYLNGATDALCEYEMAGAYEDKQKRFQPTDTYHNSGSTPEEIYNDIAEQVNYEYYMNTGICPLARDLELYWDGFFADINLQNKKPGGSHTYLGQYFTIDLFEEFGGAYPASQAVTITGTGSGSMHIQQFTAGASLDKGNLTLVLPSTFSKNWNTYGDNWTITRISNLHGEYNAATKKFEYQVLAAIDEDGTYKEIVLEGTTEARISDCSVNVPNGIGEYLGAGNTWDESGDCNKETYFSKAMVTLLNELAVLGQINASSYDITQLYSDSYLSEYYGTATTVLWGSQGNGNYTLTIDGELRMQWNLDRPIWDNATITDVGFGLMENPNNAIVGQTVQVTWHANIEGSGITKVSATGTATENEERILNFLCCGDINDYLTDPDEVCIDDSLEERFGEDMANLMNALIVRGKGTTDNLFKPTLLNEYPEYTTFLQEFFTANSGFFCSHPGGGFCDAKVDFSNLDNVYATFGDEYGGGYSFQFEIRLSDIHTIKFDIIADISDFANGNVVDIKNDFNASSSSFKKFKFYYRDANDDVVLKNVNIEQFQHSDTKIIPRRYYLSLACDLLEYYENFPFQPNPENMGNEDIDVCPDNALLENQFEEVVKDIFNAQLEAKRSGTIAPDSVYDELFFGSFQLSERIKIALEPQYQAHNPPLDYDDAFSGYFKRIKGDPTKVGLMYTFWHHYISFTASYSPNTFGTGYPYNGKTLIYLIFEEDFYDVEEILDLMILSSTEANNSTVSGMMYCSIRYRNLDGETRLAKNVLMILDRKEQIDGVSYGVDFTLCDLLAVDLSSMTNTSVASSGNKSYLETRESENEVRTQSIQTYELNDIAQTAFVSRLNESCAEPCLPQLLEPVSCTDAYVEFTDILASIGDEEQTYDEETFCKYQLGYLVEDYQYYLQRLGVTNTLSLSYMTIADFGATDFNYGYDGMQSVIDAYKVHTNSTPVNERKSWRAFTASHLIKLQATGACISIPNGFPVDFSDIVIPEPEYSTCEELTRSIYASYVKDTYEAYLDGQREIFVNAYVKQAMEDVVEHFDMQYFDKEYQYTLYYYDQAGNLIQTVPPQGVNRFDEDELEANDGSGSLNDKINNHRKENVSTENPMLLPNHELQTRYEYNALNQLVWQSTPDGGITRFAYDLLGRIIASQNAKQLERDTFSYTRYDGLGRIEEAGELVPSIAIAIDEATGILMNATTQMRVGMENFPDAISEVQNEVTRTQYTKPVSYAADIFQTIDTMDETVERRSRNRVTAIYHYDVVDAGTLTRDYENAMYYNYDIHGNVKELVQHNRMLAMSQDIPFSGTKSIQYEYDLISGNVHKVYYQKGKMDQFIHRYAYDADNRIVNVETSSDGHIWEKDAQYAYFAHGPLARTVLGDQEVQGVDYAYTLQGWLKGVNSDGLNPKEDLGKDKGEQTAKDAYGYTLGYYDGDYQSVGNINAFVNTNTATQNPRNLYNGNIKQMTTSLVDIDEAPIGIQMNHYQYDQLNRIKGMQGYGIANSGSSENHTSSYAYDRNGNLKALERVTLDGNGDQKEMDDLSYHYNPSSNQLNYVDDTVNKNLFDVDLDDQKEDNYIYDAIGQLKSDKKERITNIDWRVDGKVREITKKSGKRIRFEYDGLGNRIAKKVLRPEKEEKTTVYVRDAQGNVLAVYKTNESDPESISDQKKVTLIEHQIYGSSRLGVEEKRVEMPLEETTEANSYETVENETSAFGWDDVEELDAGGILFPGEENMYVGLYDFAPGSYRIKFNYLESQGAGTRFAISTDGDFNEDSPKLVDHVLENGSNSIAFDIEGDFTTTSLAFYGAASIEAEVTGFVLEKKQEMAPQVVSRTTGDKRYELSNHLGNVLSVVSDRKLIKEELTAGTEILNTFDFSGWESINDDNNWNRYGQSQANTEAGNLEMTVDDYNEGVSYVLLTEEGKEYTISYDLDLMSSPEIRVEVDFFGVVHSNKVDNTSGRHSITFTAGGVIANIIWVRNRESDEVTEAFALDNVTIMTPDVNNTIVSTNFVPDVLSYNDYYPFGMLMPNRHGSTDSYRYGFNGKEKDDEVKGEGNSYNFGARFYDNRIGRFLSNDPKERMYPQQSTYVYGANSVIALIDENGEGPVFPSENGAKAIAKDLNNIFKDKYKIDYDAFSVKKTVIQVEKTRRIKQPWYKPDTYETYYEEKTVYVLETNKKFDWKDSDKGAPVKYASRIYDAINMEHQIETIHGDKLAYGGKFYKVRDGHGGGVTESNSKVIVSSKNKSYGERGTKGTSKVPLIDGKRIGFNKGGVALHEWLYHAMGIIYDDPNDSKDEPANHMRKYFNMRTGSDHLNAIKPYKIPAEEQKKLDEEKKKTGDGS